MARWWMLYAGTIVAFLGVVWAAWFEVGMSDAIYLATGVVLTFYTVETWRLRRESQLQTELQNRPFLSLRVQVSEPSVEVVNIGKGLAKNIEISKIAVGDSFIITAPPITHIATGEPEPPDWQVEVSLNRDDPFTKPPYSDPREIAARILTSNTATVILTYASIVGQRYSTTVALNKGIGRIVADGRVESREEDIDGPTR